MSEKPLSTTNSHDTTEQKVNMSTKQIPKRTYTAPTSPGFHPRPIRIITIGAGPSGLNLIRTLRQTLSGLPFTHIVFEKNYGIGGTWLTNRYPGLRCDVPSHSYQFSWRKNPRWSNFFASGQEIEQYLIEAAKDEDLWRDVRTGMTVISAMWSEGKGTWMVRAADLKTGRAEMEECEFLIDASGILK
jgi:cation diffusion facilitator CzcD-associated flavoprotein CzcO